MRAPFSGLNVRPAQIAISPDVLDIYFTERTTNLISQFRLDSLGAPVTATRMRSPGMTPFGFKFGLRNQAVVSEADGVPQARARRRATAVAPMAN
ncbi:MAG: hypothetical protein GC161_04415 [Planctomycetaceae bacterium]|nr:hypothetical protein [Planctomycetaceae bacterium]